MVLFDADFIEGFVKSRTSKNQRLLADKILSFASTQNSAILAKTQGANFGQFWTIFITEVWQPWKTRNTYQIWVKMVLFDAEFIESFVKSKTSKNQLLLAEK